MFQITRSIWQGRFASPQMLGELRRLGITHLVNVSEAPSILTERDGPFQRVGWVSIEDMTLIPGEAALCALDLLHDCVCQPDSRVYVHCMAGWNRSPTVLWMYLIACGFAENQASAAIGKASYDAVPRHPKLVDETLIAAVRRYGQLKFQPHPRMSALVPGGS
jgi:hypothetical protein